MSGNLEQVVDLSLEEKRSLLAELLSEKDGKPQEFPLSFAQQRLWFLAQLEPDNPSYNIPQILRLNGVLDVEALEQTINAIVARHESLRTTFNVRDGHPVQIVSGVHEFKLPFTDLEGLPIEERENEARRLAIAEARRPFDLNRDLPLRAALVRIDDDDHWLFLTMHHIVSDGWSMGILTKELSKIYEAISTNQPIELPELPIQYADFAEWQREWLQGEVLDEQLGYWLNSLAGAPAELKLNTDRPRPANQTFQGSGVSSKLSPKLSRSLSEFSQREGVTLFMTMLAAFQTLLFRYTGQEDIVVGTVIAGRNRVEIESLIGFFVNTLAMRTNVSGDPTFRELLGRVKEVTLGAHAHQDLPFEKLVEELNPKRDASRSPIFQVMFGMQNAPRETLRLSGIKITRVPQASGTSKFDLTLFINETPSGLACWLEYNTDLFDKETIARMLGHFETLLEGIVANPDERLSVLPLLTYAERQQLVVEWNDTETDYPQDQCINELYEVQVERNPDAIALVFEDEQLTYAQLNVRANQLAHFLRKRGVGPGEIVGICVERSAAMVIGILGILKAGGTYLPLDLAYPHERLAFMVEDAQARVLVTQERLLNQLPQHEAEVLCLDRDWKEIAQESEENPLSETTVEHLAYVIYTSGSTGKPKGVAVPHRAVNRLVFNTNYVNLRPSDRVAQASNSSFDAATFEIWGALLQGARLVGITRDVALSPRDFAARIREQELSTIFLTTALFNQLATEVPGIFSSVRQVLFGGEAVDPRCVKGVLTNGPPERLLHVYGPTENTTFSTWYLVQDVPDGATTVPIGRAISNTQTYVLDRQLQLVPIGVPGELYIGGDGLARGYLNRPNLTTERFIPNAFSNTPGASLYKTGDLVRYLPDGNLEFLGRIDHQVKLRGYRIELGEIETTIREHAAVQDVVVTVRHSEENKSLVCYIVANSNDSALQHDKFAAELKSLLKKKLPDYMVPSYFVFLDRLPLAAGGKIDRLSLPAPDVRAQFEEFHIAPRNDLELRLAHIWERLLGVQSVGIRDNFFDLGGHSLLAVRLVSEIEKELGQRLPLVSLFQGANIEYLAGLLRQDVDSLSWPTLVEIQSGGPNVPLFCVSHPNVNALGYRSLARHLGPDQPVFGLQGQYPKDLEDKEYSQDAVDQIATEYLEALREIRPKGPYQFIGLCRGAHIAYEMARRLERDGQQVAMLGILDTWVMENTYSIFFHLEHYAGRLIWLKGLGFRDQMSFVKRKAERALELFGETNPTPEEIAKRKHHDVYLPGPNFVPRIYDGRITVFRVKKQPRQRIRDQQLGWGKLARAGVEVHFIPGNHLNVLKEPQVQGLAAELKKCLLSSSESHEN